MENTRLISALTMKYLNVYEVDIESKTGRIIKLDGYITEGITEQAQRFDYEEMLKRYAKQRIAKDDYDLFLDKLSIKSIKEQLKSNNSFDFTYRVLDDQAKVHYYTATYSKSSSENEPLKVVCGFRIVDDIIKQQNEKFNEGLNKAYKALTSIYSSMFRVDVINNTYSVIGTVEDVSKSINKTTYNYTEAMPFVIDETCTTPFKKSLFEFLDLSTIDERLKDKNYISIEFISTFHGWCKGVIFKEDVIDNKIASFIFTIEIIELGKQREQALRESAQTDLLTGIYNRGFGQQCIENKIVSLDKGFFAILDCDNFKSINDTYGHQVGDKVIIQIAKALEKASSDGDIVFRLGGDEFAIFSCSIYSNDDVINFFNTIIDLIKAIKIDNVVNNFSISLGGTFIEINHKDTFSSLYKRADEAMYESKSVDGFKATIK